MMENIGKEKERQKNRLGKPKDYCVDKLVVYEKICRTQLS